MTCGSSKTGPLSLPFCLKTTSPELTTLSKGSAVSYRVSDSPVPYKKPTGVPVNGPSDAALALRYIEGRRQEVFVALLLDARHRLLRRVMVSIGTLSAATVHPRDVFREAIRRNAGAVIVAHNHPSGNPEPSGDDLELTKRLARIGRLVGIEVLDHIIITKGGYVSLRERSGVFDEGDDECFTRAASTPSAP